MTGYLIILTNTSSKDEAQRITNALMSKRLASSVNIIGPITSTYWWQGKIEQAAELYAESAALAEKTGFDWWRRNMLISLAEALASIDEV